MYSLVNIAALVRDVARHRAGRAVATELLRAFALDDVALASLDVLPVDPDETTTRALVMARERSQPRALEVLAAARDVAGDLGIRAYLAAGDALDETTMFGAEELSRFVRHDVLADAWLPGSDVAVARFPRALDVVADGAVAAWCADSRAGRAWRAWVADVDPPTEPPASTEIVGRVRALAPDAAFAPAPAAWPEQMHEACWALHVTDRLRAAAVTQLHTLRALFDVYAPVAPPPRAVSAVVAAVHASMVADVLDDETHRAMTQPLFRLVS